MRRVRLALELSPEQLAIRVGQNSDRKPCGVSASLILRWETCFAPTRRWSKELLWNCCIVLRDEAVAQGRADLALEPHELAPHVFPAPVGVKK